MILVDCMILCVYMLQVLQVIDACTDIAYDVTAPAAGGVVSSRSVFLCYCDISRLAA